MSNYVDNYKTKTFWASAPYQGYTEKELFQKVSVRICSTFGVKFKDGVRI